MVKVGDKIKIILMVGEPQYSGKEGVVEHVDDIGQIHGSWGGCALIPGVDEFEIVEKQKMEKELEKKNQNLKKS